MLNPFTPGPTVTLSASGTSSRVALPPKLGSQVRVVNPAGGQTVFIKFGDAAVVATVNDMPVLSGATEIFTMPAQSVGGIYVAGITSTATATVYFTSGDGQ